MSYPSVSVKSRGAVLALITVNPRASLCDLMDATGLCRTSVQGAIRFLIRSEQIERVEGGQGRGKVSLFSVAAKGSQKAQLSDARQKEETVSTTVKERLTKGSATKGSQMAGPRAGVVSFEVEVQVLPTPVATQPTLAPNSQDIVREFVNEARAEGLFVSRQVVGQVAQNVKKLLVEGATPEQVVSGLQHMVHARKMMPHLLGQFVMESQMPARQKPARFGRGLSVAQILEGGRLGSYAAVVAP